MEDVLQIVLVLMAASFSMVLALFLMKVTNQSQRSDEIRLAPAPAYSQLQKFTVTNSRRLSNENSA